MITEFEMPEELQGISAEQIARSMLAKIPDAFDKTEGGFLWDMVMPSALEKAELIQFWLVMALQNNFHMWAKERWLDYHAQECGLQRRPATFSYGDVEVAISAATTFNRGFIFSVPSENGAAAIDFEIEQSYRFNEAGTYTLRVKAVLSGPGSNVKADSITIMKNPIRNVLSITNPTATSGGTEPEDDASLRERIDDFYAGRLSSFVGNKHDYIRWAKEVAGVGYAHCIPTYEGANTVKVVIADANGEPANQEILKAVKEHIFGVDHYDINRLAPIGLAKYEVVAPTRTPINYAFTVKLADGATVESVEELLKENLAAFYKTLADDDNNFGTLRYVAVSAVILNTAGVADFQDLLVNGQVGNVEFGEDKIPVTGQVTIVEFGADVIEDDGL